MKSRTLLKLAGFAAVAAALTIAAQARADTINFYLTTPESGSPPSQPVEVTVTTGSINSMGVFTAGGSAPYTAAQVTFTNPDSSVNMAPVELNVRGAFTATSTEGITTATGCCGDGAATFGTMSLETGSSKNSTITITLTAGGMNTWADAAAVLTPDSKGFEALVNDASNGTQDAGLYSVPAPVVGAGLPGLIAACGGLIALRRRRRQALA